MEDEVLRAALGPGDDCLSVEQLARYADGTFGSREQDAAAAHIGSCQSCQAELALLLAVTSDSLRPGEADLVSEGTMRIERRAPEILSRHTPRTSQPRRFWIDALPLSAVAVVLLIGISAGTFYYFRAARPPELPSRVTAGDEVPRSLSVRLRAPIGDQIEVPQRFEWLAVDRAARYRVRLMTVDRQELWSASTSALALDVPAPIRASITPGRTLQWDVMAYDAAGRTIAESGPESFRVIRR